LHVAAIGDRPATKGVVVGREIQNPRGPQKTKTKALGSTLGGALGRAHLLQGSKRFCTKRIKSFGAEGVGIRWTNTKEGPQTSASKRERGALKGYRSGVGTSKRPHKNDKRRDWGPKISENERVRGGGGKKKNCFLKGVGRKRKGPGKTQKGGHVSGLIDNPTRKMKLSSPVRRVPVRCEKKRELHN